ncbi:tetratricopeptide repeat protein [Streptomyces aureocirculatus]|uniref:tetratricopeptide repeat protein n=1 Tax=Streptomyces aureocirculatus TaxID=67275 RepID=UPI0021F22693|nr:tetratricopeptide repeat protein [Streptomyces aureocirculatus]
MHRQWIEGGTVHGSVIQAQEIRAVHLGAERPLYAVDAFPLTRPALPPAWVRQQPARLLDARYALVDFTGRHDELARLAAWRDGPDQVSALLVHGPGGQGKSRTAAQFARSSHARGWRVLQARHATAGLLSPALPLSGRTEGDAPVLMVVDYAERWPTADLIELLLDAVRQGGRVRVLLVARPRGTWWQHLVHRLGDFDIPVADLGLPGLSDDADVAPQTLFRTARDCFARALGVPDVDAVGPPDGLASDPEYHQVLAVHMAALAAVDAHRRHREAPDGAAAVSAYLLARERAHWESLHGNARVRITPDAFGQTVYTAAMTSALSHREALGVLTRIAVGSGEHADQILKDHALSYPATDGNAGGTVLEPLYPDRLAEDFLALSVTGHGTDGFPPDPWALDAPRRLLDGEPLPCLRRVLATLVATAARWPHVRAAQLEPLLRERPELGVAAGGATLAALSDIEGLDPDVLEAIETHLPEGAHTDLNSGAAALAQRLADRRLTRTHDPEEQARTLNALAQRQSHAGLHDQALKSGQRAMAIRRGMHAARTDAPEPSFAAVLGDVGVYLAKDGQFADALAASGQAVRLLRRLVDEQPGRHGDELALALSNHAADLATAGRWEEALHSVHEAVQIRRRLVGTAEERRAVHPPTARHAAVPAAHPPASAPQPPVPAAHPPAPAPPAPGDAQQAQQAPLAAALANLAICLAQAGRREEACAAALEAVQIRRGLARANPHTHEPALATALVNLSRRLTRVARHAEAHRAAAEAVAVLRGLAEGGSVTFDEDLAAALMNLGACLAPLGATTEVCRVLQEAVTVRRRLAARLPRQFEPALAAALQSLALESFRTGSRGRAGAAWDEAVELRRRFAAAGGDGERSDLAGLLRTIAWMHLVERWELPRALAAIEEAVGLLWWLAPTSDEHADQLAQGVDTHALLLTAVGRTDEAVEARRRLKSFRSGDPTPGGPTPGDPTPGGPTPGGPTPGGPTPGGPTPGGPTSGGAGVAFIGVYPPPR